MLRPLHSVGWAEFVKYEWLIGSTIRTVEKSFSITVKTEGVIIDVELVDGSVKFKVMGVDPDGEYVVGGDTRLMSLSEYSDGSFRFNIPYLGAATISLN
jgi:hypothetical protein